MRVSRFFTFVNWGQLPLQKRLCCLHHRGSNHETEPVLIPPDGGEMFQLCARCEHWRYFTEAHSGLFDIFPRFSVHEQMYNHFADLVLYGHSGRGSSGAFRYRLPYVSHLSGREFCRAGVDSSGGSQLCPFGNRSVASCCHSSRSSSTPRFSLFFSCDFISRFSGAFFPLIMPAHHYPSHSYTGNFSDFRCPARIASSTGTSLSADPTGITSSHSHSIPPDSVG